MKAVRQHTEIPWVQLSIERWLTAPFQRSDGTVQPRTEGTPQGGVVSPVLANLFLHYAFDRWMQLYHPHQPFERYAADAVVHCQSLAVAQALKEALAQRFGDCGLTLHPTKTRIVYGQDDHRREAYPETSFDFLGYPFHPRRSKNRYGEFFIRFAPAVSQAAFKPRRQTVHGWRIPLQVGRTLAEVARDYHPVVRGWLQSYGQCYPSALYPFWQPLNRGLVRWVQRKYQKLRRHRQRAEHWLKHRAQREPHRLIPWQTRR